VANASSPEITKKQVQFIQVMRRQKGISDELFAEMKAGLGVASTKDLTQVQFEELLDRMGVERGWTGRRVHSSAAKSGMDKAPAAEKRPLLEKIGALLADMKLPWSYADAIAKQMYGVRLLRWCDPEQLRAVVAALVKRQAKVGSG
jgi:hypothetical protein